MIQTNPSKFDERLFSDIYMCRLRLKQGREIHFYILRQRHRERERWEREREKERREWIARLNSALPQREMPVFALAPAFNKLLLSTQRGRHGEVL